MTKKQKKMLFRIIVTAILMIGLEFVPVEGYGRFALYLIPYGIIGYDILRKAFRGILNRQVFDENFLMAVATVGAMAIGLLESGDYAEAISVMLRIPDRRTVPELCSGKKQEKYQRFDGYPAGLCESRRRRKIEKSRSGRCASRNGNRSSSR